MRVKLVILFSFFISICFSQSRIAYPYEWKDTDYNKIISSIEREIALEKDSSILCRYYFLLSSAYANIDSIKTIRCLELSYNFSNQKCCYYLKSLEDYYRSEDLPKWVSGVRYYLHEPQFETLNKKYLEICSNDKIDSIKLNLDKLVSEIKISDQKFRGDSIVNWQSQDSLDEKNRMVLDSLFNKNDAFFKQFTIQEIEVFWSILQHSTDCTWNQKWFQRFLDAYQKKEFDGGWLKLSFERFYHPIEGFCTKQDSIGTKLYIQYIKEKYSEKFAERFGYRDY